MKHSYKHILICLSALVLLAGCGMVSSNPQAATPDPNSGSAAPFSSRAESALGIKPDVPAITIPAGTLIGVRLQSSISSASATSGDHFDAVIDEAVVVDGQVVIPKGASHKKRNVVMIGGGTAAGALIGGLAAGPKGALIGSAIGAGAGTGGAYATGKKEVGFAAERRLTFRLTQPLTTS